MTPLDWSMCEEFWVPTNSPGGGPTFGSLAALLGWLKRKGYDGRDKVWEVLALDPREDRPAMFALVPKSIVDRWMGVRE